MFLTAIWRAAKADGRDIQAALSQLVYTDRTTYVIHYTETMRDTIEVKHRNIPFASDIECPVMMFYEVENLRYTTNALDSIQLVNPKITNEETINFNIYYRASSAE